MLNNVLNIFYNPKQGMFDIKGENISFGAIEHMYQGDNPGFGLQINKEEKRDEIFRKCLNIFKEIKELVKLLEE